MQARTQSGLHVQHIITLQTELQGVCARVGVSVCVCSEMKGSATGCLFSTMKKTFTRKSE